MEIGKEKQKYSLYEKIKIINGKQKFKEAKIYKEKGNYKKALKYLLKSYKYFNNIEEMDLMNIVVLNNIGDAIYNLQNYFKALEYFHKAEKLIIDNQIEEEELLNKINRNIALCYKQIRNLPLLISYINKCIVEEKDEMSKAAMYVDLSHSHRILENYELALEYSNNALEIYRDKLPFNSFEVGNSNLTVALVYLDTHKYSEAINYLEIAEEIYENLVVQKDHLINLYELLEYAFLGLGYKDTAVFYSGKYKRLLQN